MPLLVPPPCLGSEVTLTEAEQLRTLLSRGDAKRRSGGYSCEVNLRELGMITALRPPTARIVGKPELGSAGGLSGITGLILGSPVPVPGAGKARAF
jgi:hypothetical protein